MIKPLKIPGRCRTCHARSLYRRVTTRLVYCAVCNDTFAESEIVHDDGPLPRRGTSARTTRQHTRSAGSGVIAGPIRIGRGSRWGAGLV